MADTNKKGTIGEQSVFRHLVVTVGEYQHHELIVIPGKEGESFKPEDERLIRKLYPDCEAIGKSHYPELEGLAGFAKLLQLYGCDIIETWDDHIIWHEVKTDNKALDVYPLEGNGRGFWTIAKEYIDAQKKKGTGNMFIEREQGAQEGWYPKYRRFTLEYDSLQDMPMKPEKHFLWYCLLVSEDINGEKQMLAIKIQMGEFVSIVDKELGVKEMHLPLKKIWWIEDAEKTRMSLEDHIYIDEHAPEAAKFIYELERIFGYNPDSYRKHCIKSDNSGAYLYSLEVKDETEDGVIGRQLSWRKI